MFEVMKFIQGDGMLLHPAGHAYQGKSIVPFGYSVAFTNITRNQFAQTDLREVFPEDCYVFEDEMSVSTNAEVFCESIWSMVPLRLGALLNLPQFYPLGRLTFPELRIRQIGRDDRTVA